MTDHHKIYHYFEDNYKNLSHPLWTTFNLQADLTMFVPTHLLTTIPHHHLATFVHLLNPRINHLPLVPHQYN